MSFPNPLTPDAPVERLTPDKKSNHFDSKFVPELWERWTYFAAPYGYDRVRLNRALEILRLIRHFEPTLCIHSSLEYEGLLGYEPSNKSEEVLGFFGVPKYARSEAHICALHLCHRMVEQAHDVIYITDPDFYPQRTSYGVAAELAIARNLGKNVFELGRSGDDWQLKAKFATTMDWDTSPFPLSHFANLASAA